MGMFYILFQKLKIYSMEALGFENKYGSRKLKKIKKELDKKRAELTESKIRIEECIYSMEPGKNLEDFIPPFHLWCEYPEIQEMNIEDALDKYILKYNLLQPCEPNEPITLTNCRQVKNITGFKR